MDANTLIRSTFTWQVNILIEDFSFENNKHTECGLFLLGLNKACLLVYRHPSEKDAFHIGIQNSHSESHLECPSFYKENFEPLRRTLVP